MSEQGQHPQGQQQGYGQPTSSPYLGSSPPQYGTSPQYGSPQGYYAAPPASATMNPWAIASLVLGLCATAVLAVIAGHLALSQIKRTGEQGRGLAIAGLLLGYLGILGYLVFFAALGGLIAIGSRTS